MVICKATFQNFENRLESHWVSLVSTVFRRVVRPICVVFLPLEKSPGGFCFQVPFRIRFPKPPWNLSYSKILLVIVFFCPNEVPTKSDDIWHQSNSPIFDIQLQSDVRPVIDCNTLFLRSILMVSFLFTEQFAFSTYFLPRQRGLLWRLRRFDLSARMMISVSLDSCHFITRTTTFIKLWVVWLLVMGNIYFEEFVEIVVIIDPFVTLRFIWRIVISRFTLVGIFLCSLQIRRKRLIWDLLMVRQVLRGLSERFNRGNFYHNIGFISLELCLQIGQMRTLAQWLGNFEFQESKETMVANEHRS